MNETIVDRIRALCLKNKTSITKIEVELGYANGTIGKWAKAKRKPPLEKVMAVADLLHTTPDYLYNGETPAIQTDSGLHVETAYDLLTPQNKEKIRIQIVSLLKQQSDS